MINKGMADFCHSFDQTVFGITNMPGLPREWAYQLTVRLPIVGLDVRPQTRTSVVRGGSSGWSGPRAREALMMLVVATGRLQVLCLAVTPWVWQEPRS